MAMAALAIGISQFQGLTRSGAYALPLLLLFFATATLGFWLLGSFDDPWTLRALYVWTGLVGTLAGLQFWLVVGEMYTVTQAKRLYKLVGAGSVLGAVAGGALARALTTNLPAPYLVLASAGALALTAVGPALLVGGLAGGARTVSPGHGSGLGFAPLLQSLDLLRRHLYVRSLAGLVLISTVALTLADYVFKSTVAREVPAAELGTFLATYYMALNVVALAVQVLLMGWVLRAFGLHRALWALPVLLFLGAVGMVFGGGLAAALLMKGADGSLRHSLHRTSTELLFVPLSDSLRARAKPLIDVLGQRGGQALASILILSQLSLGRGRTFLAAAAAALCVAWVAWATDLKRHYLELFRAALREGMLGRGAELPELDLASLETLFLALNSQNDAEVVGAMDLLADEGRGHLIPALILYHPSSIVVLRALDLFSHGGRTDFMPVAARLRDHVEPEVRAAALRAQFAVQHDESALRVALADQSTLVRATALVGLCSQARATEEDRRALEELRASGSTQERRALAEAIRRQPLPVFEDFLVRLAEDPDEQVQALAAAAMGSLRSPRFLPVLLPMVAQRDVRRAAREALLAIGPPALAFLDESLADQHLPHELRRHLPRTISRFPAREAAPVLLRHLTLESDGMVRFKILRGLGRIAAEHPEVPLDQGVLRAATARTLEAAFRLGHWRAVLRAGRREDERRATRGHELLVAMLKDKEVHTRERVFRLLGLLHRAEDFESIYRGLHNRNAKVRASSREFLENVLASPQREAVLALIEEGDDIDRLAGAGPYYTSRPLQYVDVLAAILDTAGESLRCIAAHHVGELGLQEMRPRLEALTRGASGLFVRQVVWRALQLLGEGAVAQGAHVH
ncbi:MAG TPA: HEAT repeat domain-containing protein [Vicinamibacteria bacterium]|nr:HEAT repeat domain-containing protein [Vicinamibacteria bacterium]